jgi:hypothetical protein
MTPARHKTANAHQLLGLQTFAKGHSSSNGVPSCRRRARVDRWEMFISQKFDPFTDLKRNSYGVLEFSDSKPDLERLFHNYLRDREEDSNIIG